MSGVETKKHKKIQEILFFVKLSSLLFAVIAYFRYFEKEFQDYQEVQFFNVFTAIGIIFILTAAFLLWIFFEKKSKDNKKSFYFIAQPTLFILFYSGAIFCTGLYDSNFKFLFIFLIVSYTIENGMKGGLIIAAISSFLILIMDLALAPRNGVNYYFEDDISLIGLFFVIAATVGYYVNLEKAHIRHLSELVNEDTLTGLYNHRYFHDCMKESFKRAKAEKKPLSLLMCDLDNFKQYNDILGHQQGDALLSDAAQFLTQSLGGKYPVYRYGGDEFAIILPDVAEFEARDIANGLREKFAEKEFVGEEHLSDEKITMSIGISTYDHSQKMIPDLLRNADEALYKAKLFRKNRVETYKSILDDWNINEEINSSSDNIITSIRTLISVINSRDKFTYTHLKRVAGYCDLFADDLGLEKEDKKQLCYAAYIHDIGKIDIPKEIASKTGKLSEEEWGILKTHPSVGAEMIKNVQSLGKVHEIILQHHERYDGKGYPRGLKGTDISYLARILTVVDSFDAMTSERPYQVKKTYNEGIEELIRCKGSQFDPDIVDKFIESITNKELAKVVIKGINEQA